MSGPRGGVCSLRGCGVCSRGEGGLVCMVWGGVWSRGVSGLGGVWSQVVCCGGVSGPKGGCLLPGGGIPACTEADTPLPLEQNE